MMRVLCGIKVTALRAGIKSVIWFLERKLHV